MWGDSANPPLITQARCVNRAGQALRWHHPASVNENQIGAHVAIAVITPPAADAACGAWPDIGLIGIKPPLCARRYPFSINQLRERKFPFDPYSCMLELIVPVHAAAI